MESMNLVALAPSDMEATQSMLTDWCTQKQRALQKEFDELDEHRMIAVANGWKLSGITSSLNRTARRITYYEKMKAAVEAGYVIVPNFPITTLAVRVDRGRQPATQSHSSWSNFPAEPQMLPVGKGRYVDDELFREDLSHTEPDGKGGTRIVPLFKSAGYDEPDFPFAAVKPEVMDATARAMALKIFDVIGLVENQSGRDPIIVGQLLDPRGNRRRSTFFIAWWLNTSDL